MIKHTQLYERLCTLTIDEGLAAIRLTLDRIKNRQKPSKVNVKGQMINTKSLRLQTFAEKGLVCACCGRVGTHFALERGSHTTAYHMNLWSTDDQGDEYLMTHDHILARSLGGADNLSNTQTMCSPCNAEKAIGERILLEERK